MNFALRSRDWASVPSYDHSRRDFIRLIGCSLLAWPEQRLRAVESGAPQADTEPVTPKEKIIPLFNSQDLTGLYPWLKDSHYADPRQVFTVADGLLRISGEVDGYLVPGRKQVFFRGGNAWGAT